MIIPEVAGDIDTRSLERELNSKCGALSIEIDASGRQVLSYMFLIFCLYLCIAISSSTFFETSPQVLNIDFSDPSQSGPERAEDIIDHGKISSAGP